MVRQAFPKIIIDPIRTHDSTPAATIYRAMLNAINTGTITLPLFSYQFYDISPHTPSGLHAMTVALFLHEGTIHNRNLDYQFPQRIDVYSFPLPAEMSEENRVEKCIAHQRAELGARMKTGMTDYFMQCTLSPDNYQRIIFIIDSSVDKFEENGFLCVSYDQKVPNEERAEDDQLAEVDIHRTTDMRSWFLRPEDALARIDGRPLVMEALGWTLSQNVENSAEKFYNWYVEEGVIYEDLKKQTMVGRIDT